MRKLFAAWCAAALGGAIGIAPLAAQDDIGDRIISVPVPDAYRVDGVPRGAKVMRDDTVQGGKALRVPVPGADPETWSVAVAVPVTAAVAAGDELIMAFWARLEKGQDGATSATLPYNAVQMAGEPYTAVFSGPATITPEWQMYEVRGRATRDYAAGELNASLHLATGRQIVDLGPVFVLNMGQ